MHAHNSASQRILLHFSSALLLLCSASPSFAVQAAALTQPEATRQIPQQVRYSAKLPNRAGDTIEATFRLYASREGGEPLWTETQRFPIAENGEFSILLGAATEHGLPEAVFSDGQTRWLGISVEGAPETDRTLMASVPFAMKSADADALSGRPASDFVTQQQLAAATQMLTTQPAVSDGQSALKPTPDVAVAITGAGTTNYVPLWTSASTLANSLIAQSGTNVGINTASPAASLDVNGTAIFRSTASLPASTTATVSSGVNSPVLELGASAFSTTSAAAVPQNFAWQSVVAGNDTAAPTANLQLLFGSGSTFPKSTGLSIASTGVVSFVAAQKFPGTSTITSINAATPLTGGGTTGALTIGLNFPQLETSFNTVYPQLKAANIFQANQTVNGSLNVAASVLAAGASFTGSATAGGGFISNNTIDLKPTALATTSAAVDSPILEMQASAYNTAASAAVAQNFGWGTFATANDTAAPSSNLELLYSNGNNIPRATGLSFSPTGIITFSPSQTFPIKGTGGGTITGVTTTSPLTGSATSGSVALGLNTAALTTTFNGLYPQLSAANTYSNQNNFISAIVNAIPINAANETTNSTAIAGTGGDKAPAIHGITSGTSGGAIGVLGNFSYGNSNTYLNVVDNGSYSAGLWGDAPDGGKAAIVGTADTRFAGYFQNNSASLPTLLVGNSDGGPLENSRPRLGAEVASLGEPGVAMVVRAEGTSGMCGISLAGSMACTGQIKALIPTQNGARQVETYSVQSAENWLEDYGSGQLHHGGAVIQLEPAFSETVNTGVEFHVFLTPGADCKGLYVTNKTATSFEVHEMGGGVADVPFDYKIVAKRRGHEKERLVDVTERMKVETDSAHRSGPSRKR